MNPYSILCVDDEKNVLEALNIILKHSGYRVHKALNGHDALKILDREHVDIAVVDYKMPEMNGIELLKRIKTTAPDIEVLILTGHGTIPDAVESIKEGAFDYILKPFHKNDLLNRIAKVIELKTLQGENIRLKTHLTEKYQYKNFIGTTPKIAAIAEMIPRIANSDSPVLILGETGTGKEVVAKAIHYSGERANRPFSVIDCASINPNLFESELFGHVKGAFTGATNDRIGLLRATGDGTLFFDEIADIPVYIQVKLLRAIEERILRPVGSVEPRHFNSRIIAATSRNLQEAIKKREFREDLFFRLNVVSIDVPTLRDRCDDIPLLVKHFIEKYDNNRGLITGIAEDALQTLMQYRWPGNVRELENAIERAFTLGVRGEIANKDLPDSITSAARTETVYLHENESNTMSDYEKRIIVQTLDRVNGNKREAARRLNIGVSTLYRKLKKYGIE